MEERKAGPVVECISFVSMPIVLFFPFSVLLGGFGEKETEEPRYDRL